MRFTLLLALAVSGCEHDLLAEIHDAPFTGCPTPAQVATGNYKVYLNTEGVTLRKGCGDDSRTNCTDIAPADNTVVPPFLDGVTGRQTFIEAVVAKAQAALAPYSVDIVTTRPVSGDYEMIVLGGDPLAFGCTNPSCGGIAPDAGCGQQLVTRDHVDVLFDRGVNDTIETYAGAAVLSQIGNMTGLVPTTVFDDCMCDIDEVCLDGSGHWGTPGTMCTFGSNAPTTTAVRTTGSPDNCNIPVEDEPAMLKAAFGCR